MAKKNSAPAPAATKAVTKTVNRSRRNAMERKCLPKSLKIQFRNADRATFRVLLASWQDSRKKAPKDNIMG